MHVDDHPATSTPVSPTAPIHPADVRMTPEPPPIPVAATVKETEEFSPQIEPTEAALLPQIPGFAIVQELGRGGMGVVYKAKQTHLNRIVALKMILHGAFASADSRRRFLQEAAVIAKLQHPHIVQVHEFGSCDGNPYFALEYLDGGTLAACVRKNPQHPRHSAQLVAQLADAIQYAHAQGIVHRDLKPANILLAVSDQPSAISQTKVVSSRLIADGCLLTAIPKITDFGLAKQLDTVDGPTATGAIMGTPSYMAPEQAAGEVKRIGPATDIHALGAILYEMLTGRPPFQGATMYDTMEQVRLQEPVAPRALQPKVPRDLETICLKCLRKEPAERYATAGALAADLRNYLADRPIAARPAKPMERLWRWCKRNPLAACFILTLCAAVAVMGGLARWAWDAEDAALRAAATAQTERDSAVRERKQAEANLLQAKHAVDKTIILCQDHELFQGDDHRARRILLLTAAIPVYEHLLAQRGDDPLFLRDQADLLVKLALIYTEVGPRQKAIDAQRRVVTICQKLLEREPQAFDRQMYLATTWNNLAALYNQQGSLDEALACLREAEQMLEPLRAARPRSKVVPEQLVHVWYQKAQTLGDLGRKEESLRWYAKALALQRELTAAAATAKNRSLLASMLRNVTVTHLDLGQHEAALQTCLEARRELERLSQGEPEQREHRFQLAHVWQNLAIIHSHLKQRAEARAAYDESRQRLEKLVAEAPNTSRYRMLLGGTYFNLGFHVMQDNNHAEAFYLYGRSVAVLRSVLAQEPKDAKTRMFLTEVHATRGGLLERWGRFTAAAADWQHSVQFATGQSREKRQALLVAARQKAYSEQAGGIASALSMAGRQDGLATVAGELAPWLLRVMPEPGR
jgi:eukaryotic-like serine/threonine-protein kinase